MIHKLYVYRHERGPLSEATACRDLGATTGTSESRFGCGATCRRDPGAALDAARRAKAPGGRIPRPPKGPMFEQSQDAVVEGNLTEGA